MGSVSVAVDDVSDDTGALTGSLLLHPVAAARRNAARSRENVRFIKNLQNILVNRLLFGYYYDILNETDLQGINLPNQGYKSRMEVFYAAEKRTALQ